MTDRQGDDGWARRQWMGECTYGHHNDDERAQHTCLHLKFLLFFFFFFGINLQLLSIKNTWLVKMKWKETFFLPVAQHFFSLSFMTWWFPECKKKTSHPHLQFVFACEKGAFLITNSIKNATMINNHYGRLGTCKFIAQSSSCLPGCLYWLPE